MKYGHFLREIVTAYEHKGGIKTLRLGTLDEDWFRQIQADCSWIYENADSSDVTTRDHVTHWTRPAGEVRQFSLFNISGKSADTQGDYGSLGDATKKRLVFPHLEGITRLTRLFRSFGTFGGFDSRLRNLRLNGIGPQSSLGAHEESSIAAGPHGRLFIVRFHLPVFSNPDARIFLDDEAFRYEEGSLYFFHHGCVHAAANGAQEPRYHLVLDCYLNKDLFKWLFPGDPCSPDPGFRKVGLNDARIDGTSHHFPDFVSEGGRVIRGPIDYGRKAPSPVAYYRRNYPSVFRFLPEAV